MKISNIRNALLLLVCVFKMWESMAPTEKYLPSKDMKSSEKLLALVSVLRNRSLRRNGYLRVNPTSFLGLLVLLAGDVEVHPGPESGPEDIARNIPELEALLRNKATKIFHQNIRGLLSKHSELQAFLSDFPQIDIITLSEIH